MAKITAVINQKGGVGKTATCSHLAYCLATSFDKKVLLIDFDPTPSASRGLISNYDEVVGVKQKKIKTIIEVLLNRREDPRAAILPACIHGKEIDNLHLIPSHIGLAKAQLELITVTYRETLLKRQIDKIAHEYDHILIDCCPTFNDLNKNAIYASSHMIIPVEYAQDALEGVADLFDFLNEVKEESPYTYKILRNGYDRRKTVMEGVVNTLLKPFLDQGHIFDTKIRQDENIVKAKANREPVFTFAPNSNASEDYRNLTKDFLNV